MLVTFNLLTRAFFPVVTRKGARRWLSVAELADDGDDAPVDFDWPRADFNTAAFEFAIGVATLAMRPTGEADWLRLWRAQSDTNELRERLGPLLHAFELNGDGPRFMQELGGLDGDPTPIEALLIDTPGGNGQKKNADVLTHRSRYPALGLPAAAMALYALQQFAPSGGAGNRTSMRGGGPMTTLVAPGAPQGERPSLWRIILANLVAREDNDSTTMTCRKSCRGSRRRWRPTKQVVNGSSTSATMMRIRCSVFLACRGASSCRAASPAHVR